ncbi:GNAT family N-acetyltransferase [Spongiimicrobium salis]|uniref:GNAT family N-acetyltransferase n=1 Tax=Spongiimicrobium salis TaxID=1667022 RepID=UPI00374DD983
MLGSHAQKSVRIARIQAELTWSIRQQVMWPNKPLEYVQLPKDPEGMHYGFFLDMDLVAVVSLFIVNGEAQFRKFATLKEQQHQGYGTQLLSHIMMVARKNHIDRIWCNARVEKVHFYQKFGLKKTKTTFSKGGHNYIIMERLFP